MKFVFIIFLVFAFLVCWTQSYQHKLLVDRIRFNFLNIENNLWDFVLEQHKDSDIDPGLEIIKRFKDFDSQVQLLPQDILYGIKAPRQAEQFVLLYSDIRIIHDLYDKFIRYQLEALTLAKSDYSEYRRELKTEDIVDDILDDAKNNVNKTISRVFEEFSGFGGIFSTKDYICEIPTQPPQQVFYNLYNLLALIDLKGYILSQFAYMAMRLQEIGNYTEMSLKAREEYKTRTKYLMNSMAGIMKISNGNIYRCDPKSHIEGETYTQLTQLLQAHVQNEVDLNPTGTCTENCAMYTSTKNYGCYDSSSEYCRKMKPCNGDLYNCRFVESHLKTCIAPQGSTRRYDFIEYDSGKVYGEKTRCLKRGVESWFRWFVHCSYCLCLCDQQGSQSDRYFNLRSVSADTKNNRVVTGMKLVKHNRIIYIQIQEGKLLPHGYIEQNSTRWVPPAGYRITDYGVKNGKDYHTMNYYSRSLLLDNLEVERENYIITGARFFVYNGDLQFRITITPFNFSTGHLYTDESYEVSKRTNRKRIELWNPDIPIYSPRSEPNFDDGRYVEFTHSDLEKDAGQTTVPFIDIQPVYADPPVPLRSAGIYYKGKSGYGGFVGMKVGVYDYTNSLIFDFPNAKAREDSGEVFGVLPN
ncbi:unnamed protein product [Psylliodes chrysocephalus]|uniref:Uncharacterized protein n=1 Tax=Psylliodes chrysocephalus TaxID=3402493 RepID=A0A9P0GAM3_9CUCU|nr:unnamed protein product [Psylliodes chrysocephala]